MHLIFRSRHYNRIKSNQIKFIFSRYGTKQYNKSNILLLTFIRPSTYIWPDGVIPGHNNIFWCSMTLPAVCFTVTELLPINKVTDHTWALFQTFLNLIYFYFRTIT